MFLNEIWQSLDPVAFSVGSFAVRWYALAYVAGALAVGLGMRATARRWGLRISDDAVSTIVTAAILGTVVGGRLGYVVVYGGGHYLQHPSEVFETWRGGMSFHGGIVAGFVFVVLACRWMRVNWWTVLDMICTWLPVGIFLGRCANFVNGELWGAVCDPDAVPWAVAFPGGGGLWRHPSQLYEAALEGLALLAVLLWVSHRKPTPPQLVPSSVFLIGYGVCRFLVEFVRVPDAQMGYIAFGWLTTGQILSVPMVVIGLLLLRHALSERTLQHAFLDGRDIGGGCEDVAGDILAMVEEDTARVGGESVGGKPERRTDDQAAQKEQKAAGETEEPGTAEEPGVEATGRVPAVPVDGGEDG